MESNNYRYKLFGVALDPVDDPWSLQLKQAWMDADTGKLDWLSACPDPYGAVIKSLADVLNRQGILPCGRFPVPSWLRPKPKMSDLPLINTENMADFFDSGRLLKIVKKLQSFITNSIFPEIPIMIGIDHSATAGVVSALAERYGPELLSIVVLDQHFDAIPLSVRLAAGLESNLEFTSGAPHAASSTPIGFSDRFCCGNFWDYLMEEGSILPENLRMIGVGDYPNDEIDGERDRFKRYYLSFKERGCSFFRLAEFSGPYYDALARFLSEKITTPYVYISLDLDVGSYNSVFAARYMDKPGISKQNLLDVANVIASDCRRGKFKIVGLDVMEFNMHFLGIETSGGVKDSTLALTGDFIKALT